MSLIPTLWIMKSVKTCKNGHFLLYCPDVPLDYEAQKNPNFHDTPTLTAEIWCCSNNGSPLTELSSVSSSGNFAMYNVITKHIYMKTPYTEILVRHTHPVLITTKTEKWFNRQSLRHSGLRGPTAGFLSLGTIGSHWHLWIKLRIWLSLSLTCYRITRRSFNV